MTDPSTATAEALNILRALAAERKSGVLAITRRTAGIHLCLQDGRVVFATSNLKRFQPAAWLAAAGLATGDGLKSAGPVKGTKELVDALVLRQGCDRMEIVSSLRTLLKEMVLESMTWDQAELRFSPGVPVLRDQILLEDAAADLISAAAVRMEAAATEDPDSEETEDDEAPVAPDPHAQDPEVIAFREKVDFARQQDHYALLDLDNTADVELVRKHYYHLARSYHPDALAGILAEACRVEGEEYFAMVTEAYNTLTRPEQRKEYDELLNSQKGRDSGKREQSPAEMAKLNFASGKRALAAGELHDATQFFRNAVQLDPEQGDYHRELGIVEMRNPRWQKSAEESLRKAVELEQTDTRALAHLGQIYQANGLKRRAMETYQMALEWDPENGLALKGLAELGESAGGAEGRRKSLFRRR